MQAFIVAVCMVMQHLATPASASAEDMGANPMRKIIGMLQSMQQELEREGDAEAELFEKALCACETGEKGLASTISESSAEIEEKTAKINAGTAEKAQLLQEVTDHKAAVASAKSDLSGATTLREKEHRKFSAAHKANKAALKQMDQAIPALEKGMSSAAFVQMMTESSTNRLRHFVGVTKYLSDDDRSSVLAFLAAGSGETSGDEVQAPGTAAIVGILKNMHDDITKDTKGMEADEASSQETFNELKKAKKAEISINEESVITKEKRVGELLVTLSEDTHALEDAQEELANAQNFLSNMKEECASKAKDRDMRAKMRKEEIAAIGEAVKILNDDDALDVFKKSLPSASMLQKVKTYDAFLQVHSSIRLAKRYVPVATLQEEPVAEEEAAEPVEAPAEPVEAVEGEAAAEEKPMSREDMLGEAEKMVKGMVNPMMKQLHMEDVEDEQKKIWCANETEVIEALKTSKDKEFEEVTAQKAELEDNLATVVEQIKVHEAAIAALDKEVTEMTKQRKTEHQEFVDEFATMSTAIKLIDKAMKRLQKFYSPKATAAKAKAAKEAALKKAGLALLTKPQNKEEQDEKTQEEKIKQLFSGFDNFVQVKKEGFLLRIRPSMLSVDPVEVPDTPKTYVKKESGGVISLMNQFKTDLKTEMTEAEVEEKHLAAEYTRLMGDAQMSRATDVKGLNQKISAKARMDESLVEAKSRLQTLDEERRNLELYLLQVHHDCDYLLANFDAQHELRIEKEVGLQDALTIVTKEEPPPYRVIEARYDEEKTVEDVEKNFPTNEPEEQP